MWVLSYTIASRQPPYVCVCVCVSGYLCKPVLGFVNSVMSWLRVISSQPIGVEHEISGGGGQWMIKGWGRLGCKTLTCGSELVVWCVLCSRNQSAATPGWHLSSLYSWTWASQDLKRCYVIVLTAVRSCETRSGPRSPQTCSNEKSAHGGKTTETSLKSRLLIHSLVCKDL